MRGVARLPNGTVLIRPTAGHTTKPELTPSRIDRGADEGVATRAAVGVLLALIPCRNRRRRHSAAGEDAGRKALAAAPLAIIDTSTATEGWRRCDPWACRGGNRRRAFTGAADGPVTHALAASGEAWRVWRSTVAVRHRCRCLGDARSALGHALPQMAVAVHAGIARAAGADAVLPVGNARAVEHGGGKWREGRSWLTAAVQSVVHGEDQTVDMNAEVCVAVERSACATGVPVQLDIHAGDQFVDGDDLIAIAVADA